MNDKSGLFISRKKSSGGSSPLNAAASAPKDVKKRWLYVGAGAIGVAVLASTLVAPEKTAPRAPREKPDNMISVTPANADKAAFEANFAKQLETLRQEQERLKSEMSRKDQQISELKTKLEAAPGTPSGFPPGVVPPPVPPGQQSLGTVGQPLPPAPPSGGSRNDQPPAPALDPSALPYSLPLPEAPKANKPLVFEAPQSSAEQVDEGSDGVASRVRYVKNPSAGLLPAGSFAPVSLLNGLDAGTSSATQSNPMPVLMRVNDNAILPGSAKYKLKSCFVLGTGYGDLSAERVYVRFSRLSCVDKDDKLVMSQEVQGYLVDSDGKLGLRGVVTDRQGARLAKAMLAGFAQGLAGALGSAQSTLTTNLNTGESTSSLAGSAALRAAGLTGAQTAVSQLAEFYLREAQSIFPVISVDAGRTGTIVFSASAQLTWGEGQSLYRKETTPTN
jgi:conjugal transfer pilus assembly protein TraB